MPAPAPGEARLPGASPGGAAMSDALLAAPARASRTPARDALRAATAAAHERLHHLPAFAALAEGRIGRDAYAALLRRKLGFHAALEEALAAGPGLGAWGVDLAARRRAPLLRADLAALGAAADGPRAPLPPLGTTPRALGALYVAEGATLGGQVLARALDGLLPPGGEGRRFLLGHGASNGAMWRACCAAIERCGEDPARRAAMVAAAVEVFGAFEAWFGAAGWSASEGGAGGPGGGFASPP